MSGTYTERAHYALPKGLKDRLELAAKADEVTASEYVRAAIKRRLDDTEPQPAAG